MPELFCEEIAHRAGFIVSVGNWITPDGILILGNSYETHHWETIKKFLNVEPVIENYLTWMNEKVYEGFIRLVFRNDVLFQVGCEKKEDIWSDEPNLTMMREILKRLPEIEIHIFSRTFYVIGLSKNILDKSLDKLQIQEVK